MRAILSQSFGMTYLSLYKRNFLLFYSLAYWLDLAPEFAWLRSFDIDSGISLAQLAKVPLVVLPTVHIVAVEQ